MAQRPVSAFGLNKALTNYAKKGSITLNPRFLVIENKCLNFPPINFVFKRVRIYYSWN
jgi:hypothetical protein